MFGKQRTRLLWIKSLTWICIDEESVSDLPSIGVKYKCRHPHFQLLMPDRLSFRHCGVESSAFVQVVENLIPLKKHCCLQLNIKQNSSHHIVLGKRPLQLHCHCKYLPINLPRDRKSIHCSKNYFQNAKSHEQVAARVDSQDINVDSE